MDRSKYKKVTNQSISEIEVDQNFDQIMTHLNSKNPESPITFPADTEIVLPKISLEGIVTIQKDENGKVGLEIPDLLSINNQEYQAGAETLGTNGNLCLRDRTADYLIETNIIELTFVKDQVVEGIVFGKIYKDSIENNYLDRIVNAETQERKLLFIGAGDRIEEILPITNAPNWNKDSIFKLVDINEIRPMVTITSIIFDQMNTSTIIAPKTVYSYFQQGGIFKNFSGIFDISHMNPTTEERSFIFDTDHFENCEDGTLRVNASQWEIFETAERITDAEGVKMLDGKIKIVKATEGGSS